MGVAREEAGGGWGRVHAGLPHIFPIERFNVLLLFAGTPPTPDDLPARKRASLDVRRQSETGRCLRHDELWSCDRFRRNRNNKNRKQKTTNTSTPMKTIIPTTPTQNHKTPPTSPTSTATHKTNNSTSANTTNSQPHQPQNQ